MEKIHLIWIIALCFMSGLLCYSLIDNSVEGKIIPLIGVCIDYELKMDIRRCYK